MRRPTLLLVGSGRQGFREYIMDAISADHRIALITGGRCTWQRPYIVDYEPAELSDVPALLRAAMALAARNELAG
ncbi:MAG: hypothetical protein JXA67_09460, partial [Micromonosporaceae bacterium]|nr:hypothetical protein [Micromonosporaceae bacterium]